MLVALDSRRIVSAQLSENELPPHSGNAPDSVMQR